MRKSSLAAAADAYAALHGGFRWRVPAAFNIAEHRTICVPTFEGKRGNPVLWGRRHFIAIDEIEGDQGARLLMDALSDEVVEVEVKTQAVLVDVDTPQALQDIRLALNP